MPDEGISLKLIQELSVASRVTFDSVHALAALAIVLLASIVALFAASLVARGRRERSEAREALFRSAWEPVLHARMAGEQVPLPPLGADERFLFVSLWLHMLGYVRDEAADELVQVAMELDMPRHALAMLASRLPFERRLATRMAGALRLTDAVGPLLTKVAQRRTRSSFEAASALLKIDPGLGVVALRDWLMHMDWSPSAIMDVVKGAGPDAVRMLGELLAASPPGRGRQVVRLIELLEDYASLPGLLARLKTNTDDQETAVILHALGKLGGAAERETVAPYASHPAWLVRMQAAAALGTLGTPGDVGRLLPLLSDTHWWVRYRAAQAVFKLGGRELVERVRAGASDRFAVEILEQVAAEC